MDLTLTEAQQAWQLKARKFATEVLRPRSLARDRITDPRATFDWEVIREGSRLGFRTLVVDKKFGGYGVDLITQALVIIELAKGDSAMAKTFSQCWKWTHLLQGGCTPQQLERFVRPFAEDETFLLGQAGTEPNSGSDHRLPPEEDPRAGWRLKAEPVDNSEGADWILNGEKCFIANGSVARLFLIGTRTNPNVPQKEGGTMFAVPVGTPGMRIGKVFNKSGWRFYQNGELIFDNARVPHANIIGEVNGGHRARSGGAVKFGDLELSANAVGVCDAAVEMATHEASTRWPGTKYFKDNQTIQLQLSEMHMLTEALRSFVMRVAMEADAGLGGHSINNVLLMNFASDVIQRVTRLNMDIHGGAGVSQMDPRVDKLARDAIIWTHLAGDSVQRMKAVRRLKWS